MTARCLQVGTNYKGSSCELRGCLNDLDNIRRNLLPLLGVYTGNLVQLLSEKYTAVECRKQMQLGLELTKAGDVFIFNDSSHGTKIKDISGDEVDGYDEGICPDDIMKDFNKNLITDDEIHTWLTKFPKGCLVILIIDACNSGTITRDFNLVVKRIINEELDYSNLGKKKSKVIDSDIVADVVLIPGCKEDQTSADAYIGGIHQGALTYYLVEVLKSFKGVISNKQLVSETAKALKRNKYTQVPVLYCTNNIENKQFGKI